VTEWSEEGHISLNISQRVTTGNVSRQEVVARVSHLGRWPRAEVVVMLICSSCRRALVEIELKTPEAPVTLRCCSDCDRREWLVDGRSSGLDAALKQLATTARRRDEVEVEVEAELEAEVA